MAKKRTKADKLQRNVEQLEKRDDARREKAEIDDKRSDPPRTIPDQVAWDEQIRQRAFELYESRGREDGHELDDWLQAEGEILGTRQEAAA